MSINMALTTWLPSLIRMPFSATQIIIYLLISIPMLQIIRLVLLFFRTAFLLLTIPVSSCWRNAVIETLGEFHSMLLGAAWSAHLNWLPKSYAYQFTHSTPSLAPLLKKISSYFSLCAWHGQSSCWCTFTCPPTRFLFGRDSLVDDEDSTAYAYSILRDDESLLKCFLHHPYLGEDLVQGHDGIITLKQGYDDNITFTGMIISDQTGRFVLPSSTGNIYVMIVYNYDSNYIFAHPFRNRTTPCILEAYKTLHWGLCKAGLCPKL